MRKFGFGGMEATAFKRRADGWLFAVPHVWPRRTYLVTDEQKTALVKPMRRLWWAQILTGTVVTIALLMTLQNQTPLIQFIVFGIAVAVCYILQSVFAVLIFRPMLADLPQTSERIPRSDIFKAQAAIFPTWLIVIGALTSLVTFAGCLFLGFGEKWDWVAVLGSVMFGGLGLYWTALFFVKERAKAQT